MSSSSSSSSIAPNRSTGKVHVPRNIARLPAGQSVTIITTDTKIGEPSGAAAAVVFKIPPIPLGMSNTIPNIPTSPRTTTAAVAPGLKRLSLLSPRAPTPRSNTSTTEDASASPIITTPRASFDQRHRIRGGSSISYSPSGGTGAGSSRSSSTIRAQPGPTVAEEDASDGVAVRGRETTMEKHQELMRMIAQKERLVAELRQELQAQETSLSNLKVQYASLVTQTYSSTAPSPPDPTLTPIPTVRSQVRSHRASQSTTSSIASSTTLDQVPFTTTSTSTDTEVGTKVTDTAGNEGVTAQLNALFTTALGSEPLLSPDMVEGGKKFWGNLMKTLGDAAGGNVPALSSTVQQGAGVDLLKGILPWGSSAPTEGPRDTPLTQSRSREPVRIRPSSSTSSTSSVRLGNPPRNKSTALKFPPGEEAGGLGQALVDSPTESENSKGEMGLLPSPSISDAASSHLDSINGVVDLLGFDEEMG